MKIIVQQNHLDKFINNILNVKISGLKFIAANTHNQLYAIYEKIKPDCFLFNMSQITQEATQFIVEYNSKIKFFIYHDVLNKEFISAFKKSCTNIIPDDLPTLINTQVFKKTNTTIDKQNIISCFLDGEKKLQDKLKIFLYPQSINSNIRMYNNPYIKHPQNIGMINEHEKAFILNNSQYYLAVNDRYVNEALYLGCQVLTPEELIDMRPKTHKILPKFVEYSTFIKEILDDNK